jgi:YggT family protein
MRTETREREVQQEPLEVEHTQIVDKDPYAGKRDTAYRVMQGIYLIFGIIAGLVGIRFILRALGASPNADFAAFIYGVTEPLVRPFTGLFGTTQVDGAVFEPQSLVAIIIYALVGWLLGKLVTILIGETRTGRVQTTTHEDTSANR